MSLTQSQNIMKALEVVGEIFREENIQICVKESVKGGLITGVSALVGGLLGGKVGMVAGGLAGTFAAFNMTPDYKSLTQIIHEMDYEKSKKLFDVIQNAITSIDITDIVKFTILLTTSQSIKQTVIHETINYLRNDLSLQITQN